jgi:hypothetical protein
VDFLSSVYVGRDQRIFAPSACEAVFLVFNDGLLVENEEVEDRVLELLYFLSA